MWLLYVTGPAGEAPATFWLPCGTFVVGRKEGKCDILIVNMTVSRQHGLFVVQPQAQSTAMARISFADSSAAGSRVDGNIIKSSTAQLHSGSSVTVGSHHVIRAVWEPVVCCMAPTMPQAAATAAELTFLCVEQWDATCTHLIVDATAAHVSGAAACAIAAERPIVCAEWLAACLQRASLQMPLPDASSYAAPPDLASVEGSAAVMTGGGKTARGSSLAGRTCILTEAAQDPDLATAVELSGASAVTASAAGPALSRRDGAFLVLQDDGCADRDRASLPAHLRGLPYTTAPLLAAAIISRRPAALAAILRTADTAEPQPPGDGRHTATPRRGTRSQMVDATADASEAPSNCTSAAAPDQSAPPSAGNTRKRQAAGDAAEQRPVKRRPTRRVSDIPSQGSPTAEESADEAADLGAGGTDAGGDHTEQGSPPRTHKTAGTSPGTSAGAEEALPKQPPVTGKRKRTVGQTAIVSAASQDQPPSACTEEPATPAAQTAASGGVSTAEPRGTPAAQPLSQLDWRRQRHKQPALNTAATQQPAPTVKAKATNGRRAPKGRAVPAASQAADQMDQDLDGGPASTDPLGPDTAQMMAAHEPEFTAIAVFLEPTLLVKVHAPLADPAPTPPQWAGFANYKAFRKQRKERCTTVVPYGDVSSVATDAEELRKEDSRKQKKARAAEDLFTAKVGKPRKATAKR